MDKELEELREYYESDLFEFAKYLNPNYMYGDIHEKVFKQMGSDHCSEYELYLLPRDHLKSHCIAVWCAWQITKEPWSTLVYLSAGEDLATNQMYAIKGMFTSYQYTLLWPEMFNPIEGKRDKWASFAINCDHPKRKERAITFNTIIIKTVKSNATGLHCSHLVLDDVQVPQNSYSTTGRAEVRAAVSQFASIKSTGAVTKAVGTRYHPDDIYSKFKEAVVPTFDKDFNITGQKHLWSIMEEKVEDSLHQDGSGRYLWPSIFSPELKQIYGFNPKVLAQKKSEYVSLGESKQYKAQYYHETNDPENDKVESSKFIYYDVKFLKQVNGKWYFKGKILNIFAGMDLGFTDKRDKGGDKADYSAIAVIGVDYDGYILVLELDRFKTDDWDVYYSKAIDLSLYWGFKKLRIETNSGGKFVKREMDNRVRANGQVLEIEGKQSTKHDGAKKERHAAILEPRYKSSTILHYKGGLIKALEEEVRLENPTNDDLEDAMCAAIEISRKPGRRSSGMNVDNVERPIRTSKFGGRRMKRGG